MNVHKNLNFNLKWMFLSIKQLEFQLFNTELEDLMLYQITIIKDIVLYHKIEAFGKQL